MKMSQSAPRPFHKPATIRDLVVCMWNRLVSLRLGQGVISDETLRKDERTHKSVAIPGGCERSIPTIRQRLSDLHNPGAAIKDQHRED